MLQLSGSYDFTVQLDIPFTLTGAGKGSSPHMPGPSPKVLCVRVTSASPTAWPCPTRGR